MALMSAMFLSCSDDKGEGFSYPRNVTATDGDYVDRVLVTWDSVSGATRYYIYRCETSDGDYIRVSTEYEAQYIDYNISEGTTYYYKVKAWSTEDEYSSFSNYDSGYIRSMASLAAPTGVSATDGTAALGARITVIWNAVSGGEKYYIYRSGDIAGDYTLLGVTTTQTYNDTDVEAGDQFWYKVKAWSSDGYSVFSHADGDGEYGEVLAALDPPDTLSVSSVYGDRIEITWNDPNFPAADSYVVYRSTELSRNYVTVATPATTSYTDTTADAGVLYYYKIKAISSSQGNSYASSAESGIRTTPLSVPTGFTATDGSLAHATYIAVSWNAVSGADRYILQRATSDSGPFTTLSSPTGTSYNDTTATAGTVYWYRIRANDSVNAVYSRWSAVESGYRPDSTVSLVAPTSISATDDLYDDMIVVTWNAVGNADRYIVYRCATQTGTYTDITGQISTLNYEDSVAQGQTYWYRVSAYSTTLAQESAQGTEDQGSSYTDLTAPTTVSATNSGTAEIDRITISWDSVSGADKYYIYRSDDNFATDGVEIGVSTGTSFDDFSIPVQDTNTYYYKIMSWSETGGYSALSASTASGNKAALAQPAFTTLETDDGASNGLFTDRIRIEWSAVTSATDYYVYRSTTAGGTYTLVDVTGDVTYDDTDASLVEGQYYYYRIRSWSVYYGLSSEMATQASGYVLSSLDAPVWGAGGAENGIDTTEVTVSWQDIAWGGDHPDGSGTKRYYIYRSTSSTGPFEYLTSVDTLDSAEVTTYDDVSVTGGVEYWYTVKAYHSTPIPVFSDEISPPDDGFSELVPPTITATKGTSDNGSGDVTTTIRVSWNTITGAEQYEVFYSDDGGSSYSSLGTTTDIFYNHMVGTANAGTLYLYRVQAQNTTLGSDSYSDVTANTAEGFLRFTTVADIAATKGTTHNGSSNVTTTIRVSWTAKTGANRYEVFASTTGASGTYSSLGTTADTYYNYAAAAGTLYHFKVVAQNTGLGADYAYATSDIDSTTAAEGFLRFSVVTGIAATKGTSDNGSSNVTTTIRVSWTAKTGADQYEVFYSTDGGTTYNSLTTTSNSYYSYAVGTANAGTLYLFKVVAQNTGLGADWADADSDISTTTEAEGFLQFTSPTITATQGTSDNGSADVLTTIRVSWTAVTGAVEYELFVSTTGATGTYSSVGTQSGTEYNTYSGTAGQAYYFKVQVHSDSDTLGTDWANADSDLDSCTAALGFVRLAETASVSASRTGVLWWEATITWDAVSGADRYDLYRSTSAAGTYTLHTSNITSTTETYTYTLGFGPYYYKIVAKNSTLGSNADSELSTAYDGE